MSDLTVTIRCKYSCALCGLERAEVDVPSRGEENVLQWLEGVVAPALSADHNRRSPNCRPANLSSVMIPFPEGTLRVGAALEH